MNTVPDDVDAAVSPESMMATKVDAAAVGDDDGLQVSRL